RIARKRHRLAAAAAEIDMAPLAAAAGFLHPVLAAEGLEGRPVLPDVTKRPVPYPLETERGDRLRRMAGEHGAVGGDIEPGRAPAAHAGLRELRVMIGGHIVDDEDALQPLARCEDDLARPLRLRP